jgi:malic enzyme
MGIPVGKLSLYVAGAGIHPRLTLPVSLDVGTDNQRLLADASYQGFRRPRLRGAGYDRFIEAFVAAVLEVFPKALLQWEDFKQHNAIALLDRYRTRIPCFNDDIQGTSAVALAGIQVAVRATGGLLDAQRFVFVGAGAAGIGMARLIYSEMIDTGTEPEKARQAILMLDSRGLIYGGRDHCENDKLAFAADAAAMARLGLAPGTHHELETVVQRFAPTVLIGTSGTPGTFTEKAIRDMAARTSRPVVFPMSNPTTKSEATPADILSWTDGRALVATGSPFPPVQVAGRQIDVGQANNVYVFPGIGLGAIVADAAEVTDGMLLSAAHVLADWVTPSRLAHGALYPPLKSLRDVSRSVAIAVGQEARDAGVGRSMSDAEIEDRVERQMWWPDYVSYRPLQ